MSYPRRISPMSAQSLVLLVSFLSPTLFGQGQPISTVAGGGPNNVPATQANIQPVSVAVDAVGNYYVAVASQNRVFRISSAGTLAVFAGNGLLGYSGDGGDPTAARLSAPSGVAVDSNNLYIADTGNNRIRKVSLASPATISTMAGNGSAGFSGDGGSPQAAALSGPVSIAVDSGGNVYIADQGNNCIRKVTSGPTSTISTIAGTVGAGFSGDGGSPVGAQLSWPSGVAVDGSGNLYIADQGNNRIRKVVFGSSPRITTVAGNGSSGFGGDGGAPTAAQLSTPASVAVDGAGNLFIADQGNNRIREVVAGGSPIITTVAGTGGSGFGGDGGTAINAILSSPSGVALDATGDIYIADTQNNRVRFVAAGTARMIQTIAGNGAATFSGDGLDPQRASLGGPFGVAVDGGGNLYIADSSNNRIREVVSGASPTIVTLAGTGTAGFSGDGGTAVAAQLDNPMGVAVDGSGSLYIADTANNRIRKITSGPNPTISTVVGSGIPGYSGDGGSPASAQLSQPTSVALDAGGNLFIADSGNHVVRSVSFGTNPRITTVAGTGTAGFSGDGGNPAVAALNSPTGVALDGAGNLYIADYGNQRVRKVTFGSNPTISTVAGTGSVDLSGLSGSPTSTSISNPFAVVVDRGGNLYVSEAGNDRIRELAISAGSLLSIAGDGTLGFSGDGGPATAASLGQPAGLALDSVGNLYLASPAENRIRKIAAVAVPITPASPPQPNINGFVTGYDLGSLASLRNSFSGWVGMKLTVGGSPLIVNSVGRVCVSGNSGAHSIKFVNAATGADVGGSAVSVNMAGCGIGQFVYSALSAPVTLQAGTSYYLVSQELSGGDFWYDHGPISTAAVAAVNNSVWFDGVNWNAVDGVNSSYVPPSFTYTVGTSSTIAVTVQAAPAGVAFLVDGASYNSSQTFNWTAGSTHVIAAVGTQSSSTGSRWVWSSWSDGGALSHSITPSASATFIANFGTQYLLSTSVAPAGAGNISMSPASPDGYYNSGTPVQLTSAPNAPNTFGNWSGDLTGTVNPQIIIMSAPHSVTANLQTPAPSTPPSGQAFVNGYNYTHPVLRNDFGGWVGMSLTVGTTPLNVSSLGRVCVQGNSASHTVKFVNAATRADVSGSAVSVSMSGCTAGQFVYTTLAAPVTLNAGATYYLVSQEAAGGDVWYNYGSIGISAAATVNNSVWFDGTNWDPAGGTNTSYVPPNFTYTLGTSSPPAAPSGNTPATPSASSFVNGYNYSHPILRNNYSGWAGMKLTIGASPLNVNSLGRLCVAGNAGAHSLKFVNATNGADVAGSVTSVNMAGCTGGQFVYSTLPTPITLAAGVSYYLVSQETAGGDQWYDYGSIATSSVATVNNSVWFDGVNWNLVSTANTSYVPPDFTYTAGATPPIPSVTAFVNGYNYSHPSLRNDFGGWVGIKLSIGASPLNVYSLGRLCLAGNTGTHILKFVNAASGANVPGSVISVNMGGCTNGQFVYSTLATPVSLGAGGTYYLVSQEALGGDQWYDYGSIGTSTGAAVNNAVWFDGVSWNLVSSGNVSFVPPNFTYAVGP